MALIRKLKHGKWRLILAFIFFLFLILFLFSNISSKYQHKEEEKFLSSNGSVSMSKTSNFVQNQTFFTTKRTTLKRLTEKVFTEAKKKKLTLQQASKLRGLVHKYGVCLSKHFKVKVGFFISRSPNF